MSGGQVGWYCADCRYPAPDARTLDRYPELASHPALREVAAANPRFTARLELEDDETRFQAASALASRVGAGASSLVLSRMAAALRDPRYTGGLDVDVSDVDVAARVHVTQALHSAAYGLHTSQVAAQPLARLMGTWERWVDSQLVDEDQPQPPTQAELQARDRAAVRASRERVVG